MFVDDHGEFDLALCVCCEEKAATATDPDVGGVCGGCLVQLALSHARMIEVEGIKTCAEVRRSRR